MLRHAGFGPKGFASVVYAILVLQAGAPEAEKIFQLAALVIAVSITLHSSSDVLAARWLNRPQRGPRFSEFSGRAPARASVRQSWGHVCRVGSVLRPRARQT
jgi:NhaP-type Na+/H+ or K+/H+ antiporter